MRLIALAVSWRQGVLALGDTCLLFLGFLGAAAFRLDVPFTQMLGPDMLTKAAVIALVVQLSMHYADLYSANGARNALETLVEVLHALGAAGIILAVLFYWIPSLRIDRGIVLIACGVIAVLVMVWRLSFNWLATQMRATERLLIVGTSSAGVALARELYERRRALGVELVGFVDADPTKVGQPVLNPGVIGTIADIPSIVKEHKVDRVVVSLADSRGKLSMNDLLKMKLNDGVRFDHLASVYEYYTGKIAVENLRPSWLIFSEGFRKTATSTIVKRLVDVTLAVIAIVLLGPILLLVALGVRLSSAGPALYHQKRVGLNGRHFTVHKFRSMRQDAEAKTGAVWSQVGDPRVTGFGRFLRRTRLDELPQLWNVLLGDMSWVGPRPERPEFVARLTEEIPFYGQRHVVRPGLSGWAQVRHAYGSTDEDALQKLQFDLFYIKHMSLTFDLLVLLETVKTVVVRRGS